MANVLDYKHGIRLTCNSSKKDYIMLHARNEHDRSKFVEDLKEAILEVTFEFAVLCLLIDLSVYVGTHSGNHA